MYQNGGVGQTTQRIVELIPRNRAQSSHHEEDQGI